MPIAVNLATCRERPALTPDDDLLRQALERRGATVDAAPWETIVPRDMPGLVCLRSTWDYHRRWPEFRHWIEQFTPHPGRLWNPAATVLWNADKAYLRELAEHGVRVPPTRWSEPDVRPDTAAFFRETGERRAVLKPRVSATAYGTHMVDAGRDLTDAEWAPLVASGALLQAFVPEIADGEASLMFVDGAFTHAVRKRPAPGDFRVQRDFGGRIEPLVPSPGVRAFAENVLTTVAHGWVYARVDVVGTARGPVLMELELIEPDLFLALAPEAAERLAAALLARAAAFPPAGSHMP